MRGLMIAPQRGESRKRVHASHHRRADIAGGRECHRPRESTQAPKPQLTNLRSPSPLLLSVLALWFTSDASELSRLFREDSQAFPSGR